MREAAYSVQDRQGNVEENDVRIQLSNSFNCPLAIFGHGDHLKLTLEQPCDGVKYPLVVFSQQYPRERHIPSFFERHCVLSM